MKKAIIAVPYLKGMGGTETVIKNFAEALDVKNSNNDISWKLISFGGTDKSDWLKHWNKKVYNFSKKRYIQLAAYAGYMPFLIANILKKEKPDFFIATNPIIWSMASKFRKLISPNTKIIAWYHYSFKMKNVKLKYLKGVDEFWAISSGIKKELVSMGIKSENIRLIYNPLNFSKTHLVKRSPQHNHFIYIGRIDYQGQKNTSELIHAFNNVKNEWSCDFYGSVYEQTKIKLKKIAYKDVQEKICFKGFHKDIWSRIEEADALILTSKFEGLPMVLIEAASRGIPIISSDCPTGTKDIVNENNGWLYKMGESGQLANILNDIISLKRTLPSSEEVEKSVHRFNYENYKIRILKSLRNEK